MPLSIGTYLVINNVRKKGKTLILIIPPYAYLII